MYIVAYDISNEKRLRKVANVCEQYLIRVQKSVFEGELTKSQLFSLKKKLKILIKKKEDSILIYFLTKASMKKKMLIGKKMEDTFIIV